MVLDWLGVISCVVTGDGGRSYIHLRVSSTLLSIQLKSNTALAFFTGYSFLHSETRADSWPSHELFNLEYKGNQYRLLSCLLKWLALP